MWWSSYKKIGIIPFKSRKTQKRRHCHYLSDTKIEKHQDARSSVTGGKSVVSWWSQMLSSKREWPLLKAWWNQTTTIRNKDWHPRNFGISPLDYEISIPNYALIRNDRSGRGNSWGGVIIYYKDHLDVCQFDKKELVFSPTEITR